MWHCSIIVLNNYISINTDITQGDCNDSSRKTRFICTSCCVYPYVNFCLRKHTMKVLKFVWSVLMDLAQASHSAHLARNGQIERAKSAYK
jgi:hypothetical protein